MVEPQWPLPAAAPHHAAAPHLSPRPARPSLCPRPKAAASLKGLCILDIGCGGGLVAEPLARLGARVTGIDPAAENIEAAQGHARGAGLEVTYKVATAEQIADLGATFDAVLLLEVIEHVPDVPAFLARVAPLVKPGGIMILSTLNRTLKAYALAIIGAEFILRWLPVGTHQWQRLQVGDLRSWRPLPCGAGLTSATPRGLIYDPFADEWRLSSDTDVNYFATAMRR